MAAPAQTVSTEAAETSQADAFRRLAERRLNAAYRLAAAILHDPADAEDATHDAFVLAWNSWGTLRNTARFDAWFDRILVNVCRNRLRWAGRRRQSDLTPELVGYSPDPYRAAGERDAVEAAMRALTPEQRIVVVLRFYLDLSVEDTAARMGIPRDVEIGHCASSSMSASAMTAPRRFTAWCSRDLTVPRGIPIRAAVSSTLRSRLKRQCEP